MNRAMNQPNEWSFAPRAVAPTERRTPGRATVITAVVVVVVLTVALVTWLVWPGSTSPGPSGGSQDTPKPLLSDKPPTVIEHGIEPRTLYPPGYVDFDYTKVAKRDTAALPDLEYDTSATPADCQDNPLFADRYGLTSKQKDPDGYDNYPVSLFMFPVDDPGGNVIEGAFSLDVWPAKKVENFDAYRQWYGKCENAKITLTTSTKEGKIVEQKTKPNDEFAVSAPSSEAVDSFAVVGRSEDQCSFYGLVRGMIVGVTCPPTQKAAGVQLWRTVIHRIQEI